MKRSFFITLLITIPASLFILQSMAPFIDPNGDGGPAINATFETACGMAIDSHGNIFVADRRANRVRRIDAVSGIITTVAGTGERGFSGDGSAAVRAVLSVPEYVAVDDKDNLYIADRSNSRIRRVDARTNIITTIAGTGTPGYSGDGGKATEARLSFPFGLTIDRSGNIFIADTENHCIRKVDANTGIITTVAGNGKQGFSGDGAQAVNAQFFRPHVLAVDANGNLIIGDSFNQRIRRVDQKTGIITTIAGNGEEGTGVNGETALNTKFTYFGALIFDADGNLLLTGLENKIRSIAAGANIVTTIAGTGKRGLAGDGGHADQALISAPYGMVLDKKGNIYFSDGGMGDVPNSKRIRRIDANTKIITTFAGKGNS